MSYLLAFTAYVALGPAALCINILQMCSLLLWPFSPKTFRRANVFCAGLFWRLCLYFTQRVYGVEIVVTGDVPPPGENIVLFCNHQQMPDILSLMPLAHRCGRLANMKWFVKDPIKYVPGIGWGMLFLDCIFLKRNWASDANRIRSTFRGLLDHDLPFWVISFSEGTRVTPTKLKKSQEYAQSAGLRVPKHVLIPRTKGFTASVQALRPKLDAVYDVTIGYEPAVPSLGDFFKGRLSRAHLHVRRFAISDLPDDETALADWLLRRFEEKDELMETFSKRRSFGG